MSSLFKFKRDYYAGGLMILLGGGAALEGYSYQIGTLTHMGPGFFPLVLGVLLAFVGVLIAGAAAASSADNDERFFLLPPEWKGWICIIAGPVLFIVFGKFFGLAPAIFVCVFVAALGDRASTYKGSALLALCMTAFGVGLFSFVLKINFPVFRFW